MKHVEQMKRYQVHFEDLSKVLREQARRQALVDAVVDGDGFVDVLALQSVQDRGKALVHYN